MGGTDGRALILLISTTHAASMYPGLCAAYFRAVQKLADSVLDVAVRLHPAEVGMSHYAPVLSPSAIQRLRVLPPSVDLYEAILNADMVYLTNSTTCLEAMLLGTPVLFTGEGRTQGIPDYVDYPDFGGGEWCDAKDVARRCQELAHQGAERSALIERQFKFLDMALVNRGCATKAVVNEILSSAQKRN